MNRTDFKITFLDGYKINAHSDSMKYDKVFSLKLDLKKDIERYDSIYINDKLKRSQESSPECINDIETKDVDNDGISELITYQYVSGLGRSDGLGELVTLWKYSESKYSPLKNINMLTYDSPNLILLHSEKNSPISRENLTIMEYQLMLGAEVLGLGTCFLGWVSFALQSYRVNKSNRLNHIYEMLKIPASREISGTFSIGQKSSQYKKLKVRSKTPITIV